MDQPLLSVIVPCYNVEKYVENCLHSILDQSYKNIELICVDDASPDNSINIIEQLAEEDDRIKIVRHEKNKGLFHARLTGVSAAQGKYIAFVDSDDYVSCDWFRPLVKRAEEENADMVLGNIIEVDEANWKHYSNICRSIPKAIKSLYNEDVYRTFLKYQGGVYYWHVMWNKIYKREFFESVLPLYSPIPLNLTMTEDIAFSCVLYSYAKNVQLVDNDCYFYCRHKEASTSTSLPQEKIISNLKNVIEVFKFFKDVLVNRGIFEEQQENYIAFRARYFRIWCNSIEIAGLKTNSKIMKLMFEGFEENEFQPCTQYEFHLNSLNTTWDERFINLKKQICNKENKIISFDIFDTLVKRPLWTPDDVKHFIQYRVRDILPYTEEDTFIKMRTYAEQQTRGIAYAKDHSCEDITLREIYNAMQSYFSLTDEQTEKLYAAELEVEKSFLYPRESGKELYELALALNKPVIIVSDMYIEEDDIRDILSSCGYTGYHKVYVSSEYKKLKTTGNLFKIVLSDIKDEFNLAPNNMLHIGDTWNNDVIKPGEYGINSMFLPKAMDVFTSNVGDIFCGNCTSFLKQNLSDCFDTRKLIGQIPIRTMFGLVANSCFDNPFNSFQKSSRFNGDPYFMGYYALGTYLYGVAKWIFDIACQKGYDKILFIARDGYVVKKIFDMLVETTSSNIKSEYIYATRKSILPYIMDSEDKFYYADNFVNIYSPDYTYHKFIDLFAPVTKPFDSKLKSEYAKQGIFVDERIGDRDKFNKFISVFNKLSFDKQRAKAARESVEPYFKELFSGKCATFDVGYSGRIQKALSDLSGKPVDALFLHDNGYSTKIMADTAGFEVYSYYEYAPVVTDILRETFISEIGPSCVGFDCKDGQLKPVFDKEENNYTKNFAIEMMQKGAENFASDFIRSFKNYLNILNLRNIEAGYAFEYFCVYATEFDKYVFINHTIEDKVYSGFDALSLVYRWNENLQNTGIQKSDPSKPAAQTAGVAATLNYDATKGWSKLKKAFYYFLFDNKTFWQKLKNRTSKKK